MSLADQIFVNNCHDILYHGACTKDMPGVRPKWDNGESAYTYKTFGLCNRYDLRTEFPALTLRPTNLKKAMDEILWIYQKKSNNIKDLNSHIWDQWADDSGSIGKAYGYQVGVKSQYPEGEFDQMDRVLYDLKHNPGSRRIMTNLYTIGDLHEMNLYPCAYNVIYNVTPLSFSEKAENAESTEQKIKPTLNMMLIQRSNDFLVANNWNVCQYAILLMMVAQVNDMTPGVLTHVIGDAHIYNRHVPMVEGLITREQFNAPTVTLNPEVKDFYSFTPDDLTVKDYNANPQIKNIPVAV